MLKEENMTIGKNCFLAMIVFVCLSMLAGCTSYERQVVHFKMPESSPNAVFFDGAIIAARSFSVTEAKEAFGFDIRSAGIFPVQVSFDNKSNHSLTIVADQTFLIDEESNVWPILDQSMAYDRLAKKTELGRVAPEAVKSGLLLGAAGAAIGAAIGIVTGTNIGEAVGKGAAIGAAAGLTVGGAQGMDNSDVKYKIKEDLQSRSLRYRAIKSGELAYGFIFYPGEIKSAKVLRLQLRANNTGQISTFNMKLQ
jgi:uncharacterized protein YcfJ